MLLNTFFKGKALFQSEWDDIVNISPNDTLTEYSDSTASNKYFYKYRLLAIDEADNKSSSSIVRCKPVDSGVRDGISSVQIQHNPGEKGMKLTWSYDQTEGIYRFQIYRSLNNGPMRAYKAVKPEEVVSSGTMIGPGSVGSMNLVYVWVDKAIKHGNYYKYKVQVKYLDGGQSPLTQEVALSY